jgi:pimeloyl-ACP methyl ester carboxylesterase
MVSATQDVIELEYETFGQGEAMLLVMGVGAQLILWPEELCQELASHGYLVVRFDNRDAGLSTHLHHRKAPNLYTALAKRSIGLDIGAPYNLSDMAGDVVRLLDTLGLESAHLLGMSMGGMICQTVAIEHPTRVRSLASYASGAGDVLPLPSPKAMQALLSPPAKTRDQAIQNGLNFQRACGSTHFAWSRAASAAIWADSFDRAHDPAGFGRQLSAVLASGSRSPHLHRIRCPALVMHGLADPLIHPDAARKMARLIPGARLRLVEGLGHDLPPGIWSHLVDEVVRNARRASGS